MNKEERLQSIINSYGRKVIPPFSMEEYALIQYETFCKELMQENKQLKDNWNKLKDYLSENITAYGYRTRVRWISPQSIMSKMFELENGDSNEG